MCLLTHRVPIREKKERTVRACVLFSRPGASIIIERAPPRDYYYAPSIRNLRARSVCATAKLLYIDTSHRVLIFEITGPSSRCGRGRRRCERCSFITRLDIIYTDPLATVRARRSSWPVTENAALQQVEELPAEKLGGEGVGGGLDRRGRLTS